MYKQTLLIVATLTALASAFVQPDSYKPYRVVNGPDGRPQYQFPPNGPNINPYILYHRQKRQLSGGVTNTGWDLSTTGNLVNNQNHRLDGTATVAKQFGGPVSAGGTLDYLHKPSSSAASITAMHTPGGGTGVNAAGKYNIYQSPNGLTSASLSAQYDRTYGGRYGASRPNYGAFLNFNHRF